MSQPLFTESLVPMESARLHKAAVWLSAEAADWYAAHLRNHARVHASAAVQNALDKAETPNSAAYSEEEFKLAVKYKIALELFEEIRKSPVLHTLTTT